MRRKTDRVFFRLVYIGLAANLLFAAIGLKILLQFVSIIDKVEEVDKCMSMAKGRDS